MPRHGGAGNTSASTPTNQGTGVVSLPNIAANATGAVTIADKDILAGSVVLLAVANLGGDSTAGRSVTVHAQTPSAGSCVVEYTTDKLMTGTWALWYEVVS